MDFWRRPARDSSQPTPICSMMKVTEVRACLLGSQNLLRSGDEPVAVGLARNIRPKCKQANESCVSNSDLQKLSWQLRARHPLERR